MQIDRVPPLLQSIAQVRNWVVQHVPLTGSLLGYDLFIKLGNDLAASQPLDLHTLALGLPYPAEQVAEQARAMAQAGLLELHDRADGGCTVQPTAQFMSLLDNYARKFESLFIVRQDLRRQQLLVDVSDPALAEFGRLLYDRVYDLGWLYLHNFGSACFLMASLVRRIAVAHGLEARIASCYVEIARGDSSYMLGAEGYAKPGQIDGHAACIVNESMILDFGLGNVRKGYRRDFQWGVACDYARDGHTMGSLAVPDGEIVTWKDDWQSPSTDAELARYAPHIENLFGEYVARFR